MTDYGPSLNHCLLYLIRDAIALRVKHVLQRLDELRKGVQLEALVVETEIDQLPLQRHLDHAVPGKGTGEEEWAKVGEWRGAYEVAIAGLDCIDCTRKHETKTKRETKATNKMQRECKQKLKQ